jgi:hypothetical protein
MVQTYEKTETVFTKQISENRMGRTKQALLRVLDTGIHRRVKLSATRGQRKRKKFSWPRRVQWVSCSSTMYLKSNVKYLTCPYLLTK